MSEIEYEGDFRVYRVKEYWLQPLRVEARTPDYLAKTNLHNMLWDRFDEYRDCGHNYSFLTSKVNDSIEFRIDVGTNSVNVTRVPTNEMVEHWDYGVFPLVYSEIITTIINHVFDA